MRTFVHGMLLGAFIACIPAAGALATGYTNATSTAAICTNLGGTNQIYSGYASDPALQCQCINSFQSWWHTTDPPTRTKSIIELDGITTQTITTDSSTYTTVLGVLNTIVYTVTANEFGAADGYDWYGTAQPPCCSSCTIAAATVDLLYFPTPLPATAATSFVSNGYTFISPSVYIGFTSLYAFDFCGNVGDVYTSTTIAFDPTEISTFGITTEVTTTTVYTYTHVSAGVETTSTFISTDTETVLADLSGQKSQLDFRDLNRNCSTASGYTYLANQPLLTVLGYDPCHPTIVLPERVKSLDPAWQTCADNAIGGFYDPPYPLTKAAPLVIVPSTPPPAAPSRTPQPVQEPTSPPQQPTRAPSQDPGQGISSTAVVVDPSLPSSESPGDPGQTVADPSDPTNGSQTPPVVNQPSRTLPAAPPASQDPPQSQPSDPADPPDPVNPPSGTAPSGSGGTATGSGNGGANSPPPSVFGTMTLIPGGQAITSDGTIFSIPSTGGSVISSPISLPSVFGGTTTLQPGGPAFTTDGTAYSIPSTGGKVVASAISPPSVFGSITLKPGSAITTDGTIYSVPSTGGSVIASGTSPPSVFGSVTLQAGGPAITISGTVYSIALTGGSIIAQSVSTTNVGAIIVSFISPGQTRSLTTSGANRTAMASGPLQFSGNAGSRVAIGFELMAVSVVVGLCGGLALLL